MLEDHAEVVDDKKSTTESERSDDLRPKKVGPRALFSTPMMTKITLVMWVNWIIVTIGYYGISLGIGDIGPDVFINFFLASLETT